MNLRLGPILPGDGGQIRAGARFKAGFLSQNQAIATMQPRAMIVKTVIVLLYSIAVLVTWPQLAGQRL